MKFDLLSFSDSRKVILCGTAVYPQPELHYERSMNEHDLLYIYEGEWSVIQDGESYILRAGDLLFLRAHSHHAGLMPCQINTRTMFIHMNFLPDDRYDVEVNAPELQDYANGRVICLPTVTHCSRDSSIAESFRSIIGTYWSERDDRARKMTLQLNALLNELSYLVRNNLPRAEEWSVRVLQMFRTQLSHIYTLEETAEIAGMSVRMLTERFRKITGQGVHQYQINLKLEMAYSALCTSKRTIQDVATSLGFCDAYQFSKLFKKKYGLSPKHFKMHDPSANINRPPVV